MSAWRFKVSKFKNAAPATPRKEDCITDLPVSSLSVVGNGIKCSGSLLAFNIDGEGGKLGLLPIDAKGRKLRHEISVICAHIDSVADFAFSPFDDCLLATASRDDHVKLWQLDINHNVPASTSTPSALLLGKDQPAEAVLFHPTADGLLSVAAGQTVSLWDIHVSQHQLDLADFSDRLQGISWQSDGKVLATIDKSKLVKLFDPRAQSTAVASAAAHQGLCREGRVVCLGDEGKVLTTGFSKTRSREVHLYDTRKFTTPSYTAQFDIGTGLLLPFYDIDTKLIFLCGKGSNKITILELKDHAPLLGEASTFTSEAQTVGVALAPKTVVNVMKGEVARVYQMVKGGIHPLCCTVPRKSYREFHADLFPDTVGNEPGLSPNEWFRGENALPPKVSLDPEKRHLLLNRPAKPKTVHHSSSNGNPVPSHRESKIVDSLHSGHHIEDHVEKKAPEVDPTSYRPLANLSNQPAHDVHHNHLHHSESPNIVRDAHHIGVANGDVHDGAILSHQNGSGLSKQIAPPDHKVIPTDVDVLTSPPSRLFKEFDFPSAYKSPKSPHDNTPEFTFSHVASPKAEVTHVDPHKPVAMPRITADVAPVVHHQVTNERKENVPLISPTATEGSVKMNVKEMSEMFRPKSEVIERAQTSHASVIKKRANRDPSRRNTRTFGGVRQSIFRHALVTPGGKDHKFTNLRNVNTRLPLESNGFCVSAQYMAVPLSGPGGLVAIFDAKKQCKIVDGILPAVENGSNVMDLQWSPFEQNCLAVGCENGTVRVWHIDPERIYCVVREPTLEIQAHNDKITSLKFNPAASHIFATAGHDGSIKVWNLLGSGSVVREIKSCGHTILSFCWTTTGDHLAVIYKNGVLRLFDPRSSSESIQESEIFEPIRGARVLPVCSDQMLLISCFSKSSERLVRLYKMEDLSLVHSLTLDTSPQLLIPHYDYDTNVVFLTAKGDRVIHMYEVCPDAPYFLEMSNYMSPSAHQAIGLQPKICCNVKNVEFAIGFQLSLKEIESLSFTIPRVKKNFFQNDVYPESLASWEPAMTATEWIDGADSLPHFVSLKPHDMEVLYKEEELFLIAPKSAKLAKTPTSEKKSLPHFTFSPNPTKPNEEIHPTTVGPLKDSTPICSASATSVVSSKPTDSSFVPRVHYTDRLVSRDSDPKSKQAELAHSIGINIAEIGQDVPLPQDQMEGVEESEWHE